MKKLSNFNGGRDRNRGFSLIELIIAIAILVILTGLLAPQFMKYIEKSRAAACDNNIDVILGEFQVALIENEDTDITDFVKKYVDKYNVKCPSNGIYEGKKLGGNLVSVTCSKHGGESESTDDWVFNADYIYKEMVDFTGRDQKDIAKKIGLYKEDGTLWDGNIRNDTLRNYLYKKNGGKWQTLDTEFLKHNQVKGGPYYIQPYMNKKVDLKKVTENDVFVYANTTSSGNRNWSATLIYDSQSKAWYQSPTNQAYKFKDKSWDAVKADTINNKDNPWIKLE